MFNFSKHAKCVGLLVNDSRSWISLISLISVKYCLEFGYTSLTSEVEMADI